MNFFTNTYYVFNYANDIIIYILTSQYNMIICIWYFTIFIDIQYSSYNSQIRIFTKKNLIYIYPQTSIMTKLRERVLIVLNYIWKTAQLFVFKVSND